MVDLPANLSELSPEERIKILSELEEERKKALKDMEEQTKKEIDQAEQLIRKSIEDLTEEEEHFFRELEDRRRKQQEPGSSLETAVQEEAPQKPPGPVDYGSPLEEIKQETDIYAITNYNVVGEVERLEKKKLHEGLSDREQDLLSQVKYQVDKVANSNERVADDTYSSLRRIKTALDHMKDSLHDLYNR